MNRRDFKTESVELESIDDDSLIVQIAFRLVVENLLDSEIIQLIPLEMRPEYCFFAFGYACRRCGGRDSPCPSKKKYPRTGDCC